jgi:hypothetical protein
LCLQDEKAIMAFVSQEQLALELGTLRAELRAEMSEMRGELRAEMAALRGELTATLHQELRAQTWRLAITLLATITAMTAILRVT